MALPDFIVTGAAGMIAGVQASEDAGHVLDQLRPGLVEVEAACGEEC